MHLFKKLLVLSLLISASVGLYGCGETEQAPQDASMASQTEDPSATTLPDSASAYGDVGEGTAYVVSTNGTSKDGDVVQVRVSPGFKAAEISIVTQDIADNSPLFVYVDGTFETKLDDPNANTTIHLEGDALTDGEHTVSFVQYKDGDTASELVFYRTAEYCVSQ